MSGALLTSIRRQAGMTQAQLAALAETSRSTLSAYEHGRKSPTLSTALRLAHSAGFELTAQPRVEFGEVATNRGRPFFVADRLWRLPVGEALATIELPLELSWSRPDAVLRLSERRERARCYEIVLREGMPADIVRYIDGVLLVDLWTELILPHAIRDAWQPIIDQATT